MSQCYATADSPPVYVEFEGPWIVGIHPPDPSACTAVPQTLAQLEEKACTSQGLQWNGQQCVGAATPTPIDAQWWFWLIVVALLVGLGWAITSSRKTPTKRIIAFPMDY